MDRDAPRSRYSGCRGNLFPAGAGDGTLSDMEKVHTAASGFAGQVRDPAAALVLDGRLGDDIVHHGVGRSAVRAVAAIPFREKARDVVLDGFEKQRRIKARGPRNALDL